LIVSVGSALFGVDWGDPLAAGTLLLVWALIGTGAGVLSGTLFRTPEQAAAISAPIGIVFGMLGGCMWPLAIVSEPLRAAGHLVPHAWAIDAWIGILSKGAGVVGIARPLAVLATFAVALIAVATVRLRSIITA
jgi:ABC-2 type transport system permease protein